jgi:sugar phosphate isomerase/epimerase
VRHLPGTSGTIDVAAFFGALKEIAYDGPVAVEHFDAALAALPPDERVRAAADTLQSALRAAGVRGP